MYNEKKIMVMRVFKENLVDFIGELIIQFPEEPDLHIIKNFFVDICPAEEIIKYFVSNLLRPDVKNMIETKNEVFFLNNDDLFSGVKNQNKVLHLKKLYNGSGKQQKEMIWQWIQKITKIAELYTQV
jgi:hypothetical protein